MNDLKSGDKVICVDPKYTGNDSIKLEKNKIYVFVKYYNFNKTGIVIKDGEKESTFFSYRFKKYDPKQLELF